MDRDRRKLRLPSKGLSGRVIQTLKRADSVMAYRNLLLLGLLLPPDGG